MPQSSDEMRRKWGGESGVGEDKAVNFLKSRGYTLTEEWTWIPPKGHVPTEEEQEANRFLIEEWDWGFILFESPCNIDDYLKTKLPCDKCGGDKETGHQGQCPVKANPVHQHKDKSWWFYDELWCDEYGPYDTEQSCITGLKKYVKEMGLE